MENFEDYFDDLDQIKRKLYLFSETFDSCFIYDSNSTPTALNLGQYEFLMGLGVKKRYHNSTTENLDEAEQSKFWKFLYLHYGEIEKQTSSVVIEPTCVFAIVKNENKLSIINNGIEPPAFKKLIDQFTPFTARISDPIHQKIEFTASTPKAEYIKRVKDIREDIINGKYYEMNYCIEFSASMEAHNFLPYFLKLNHLSKAPFAAYVRNDQTVLMCSSPERFLMKRGNQLISQPIKGTNKRMPGSENQSQMESLAGSEKERAENVMIVDLVRNDLARVCEYGSIKVEELCEVYAYTTVNHLVSSISGNLRKEKSLKSILNALFPMGSMTGAPKKEVIKHIQLYEHSERGIYSGCLGYISPEMDFDLNVLIRTLVYDRERSEISYKVGSAITYDSSPELEYEECLLKGIRMSSVFGQ